MHTSNNSSLSYYMLLRREAKDRKEALKKYIIKRIRIYIIFGLPIAVIAALFDIFFKKFTIKDAILFIASLILPFLVFDIITYIIYRHKGLPPWFLQNLNFPQDDSRHPAIY